MTPLLCRFTDGTTRQSFDGGLTWHLPRRWSWLLGCWAMVQQFNPKVEIDT